MSIIGYLVLYCVAIVAVSLAGGWIPMWIRLTHRRMQIASSLIAGFMLGVALLHLLPHALEGLSVRAAMLWLLGGLLVMFFLERLFSYHHHDAPPGAAPEPGERDSFATTSSQCPPRASSGSSEPAPPHNHEQDHHPAHDRHRLTWTGAAVGLVVHSFIAGGALAAAVQANTEQNMPAWPGLAVFLVVIVHKPLDSMTLLALLRSSDWSRRIRHLINVLFAFAVPVGLIAFWLGIEALAVHGSAVTSIGLALASGVFLCIAMSDLLPELHLHGHDRGKLSMALLLGLALAWAASYFESQAHTHHDVDRQHEEHHHPHDAHHHEDGAEEIRH